MHPSSIAAFWMLALMFIVIPGADWAYVIAAGLRGRVAPAVAGLLTGHLAATLVVAAGVGAVLAELPFALTALTTAGAAYLVWLGIGTLRAPAAPVTADGDREASAWSWFGRGAAVSGTNPKVFLLFLALLPQFTDPSAVWPLWVQIVALGFVHVVTCAVVYSAVGLGARAVLSARPRASRIVTRLSGAAMIGIGGFLLVEQVLHLAQQTSA
ncbi:LysE family translocator [Agromyces sp. NPDC058136]|uniref:LysE family translocator n=1 Tax=Agromyces sp. NPDC058136 TaxID=3346354 RepID=UPI0036DBC98C